VRGKERVRRIFIETVRKGGKGASKERGRETVRENCKSYFEFKAKLKFKQRGLLHHLIFVLR